MKRVPVQTVNTAALASVPSEFFSRALMVSAGIGIGTGTATWSDPDDEGVVGVAAPDSSSVSESCVSWPRIVGGDARM